jgi:hypothetical protein
VTSKFEAGASLAAAQAYVGADRHVGNAVVTL